MDIITNTDKHTKLEFENRKTCMLGKKKLQIHFFQKYIAPSH